MSLKCLSKRLFIDGGKKKKSKRSVKTHSLPFWKGDALKVYCLVIYFKRFMKDEVKRAKTAAFCIKYKVNFFLLVGCLFFLNAIVYELTAILPIPDHFLYMEIDDYVPFVPEFCFFYTLFYVGPFVFLTALAFYDKKKLLAILAGGTVALVICQICYLVYNVKMLRTPFEELVEPYWFFNGTIHSYHDFCMALCHMQYTLDPMARNGIPSLHAMFGGLIFISGCPLSKGERHVPIGLRIAAIIFGLGVVCSTFFVKQHYLIDAIIGFGLALIMFFIARVVLKKVFEKHKDNKTIKLLTED